MTIHFDAIYEHGVLKPLVPLELAERQRVQLTVEMGARGIQDQCDADLLARQQMAFSGLFSELEPLPQPPDDGFSSANHDSVLYRNPA